MATTLYNHIRIEDENKPIIPNNEFKVLIDKITRIDIKQNVYK